MSIPRDMEMRGVAAGPGHRQGQALRPDAHRAKLLDQGAKTATRIGHVTPIPVAIAAERVWYPTGAGSTSSRGNATFPSRTFNDIDMRTAFFTYAYSASPGMAVNIENVGAKYPNTFMDADGDFLNGGSSYRLHLPEGHSRGAVLVGDGLRSDHRFRPRQRPAVPVAQHDGQAGDERRRLDRHLFRAERRPAMARTGSNTVPGKGFFVIFRLYGPTKAFFDKTWKLGDIEKVK